jgi:hypothetical protein
MRTVPAYFRDQTKAIVDRILFPRDLGVGEGDIEKRDGEACPIRVDPKHPLW